MDRPVFMANLMTWLRAGYPDGVPERDYQPLLALLRRQLSDEEVKDVARQLISGAREHGDDAAISRVDVGVLVTKYTDGVPSESDLRRVQERLEKKGWPLHDAR
ncbi:MULTISPECIES: DUF3349 domain-containing protein [Allobranchiibius]|uniref:DUF3349 domain-containing protein n=1 Tax=Allobranchiibius huperziae TaxID=1874116 RepID=A0A853DCT9_9MICO|nr:MULTISPECIES: DUF3349 domain-containing protein [Allobranchiibius]NYJ75172.1 hypothetical protein [Allobranchiibius huperziae]UIJ33480.1 DUF3349 domain-containing protein [Allobranchiibius sp. GilTou73]